MSINSDTVRSIDRRFTGLLIGLENTASATDQPEANVYKPPSHLDGRELLRVEKMAMRDKELNQRSYQSFLDSLLEQVNAEIIVRLEQLLPDLELLYSRLGADNNLCEVLDLLTVKACSLGRLEPVATTVPWLQADLIKMINMPKYRKTDAKGKVIPVESLRMALGFMGIDNLKIVIPSLAFRRWLPQITDPYPHIKTRLWDHALASALACKAIAEVVEIEPSHAFTLGMFHEAGKIVLTRLYFKLFDEVQRDALQEAHNERMKEEHSALRELQPSGAHLAEVYDKYSTEVSSRLIRRMDFKRLPVAAAMEEVAINTPFKDMSPLAKTLLQGAAFSKYSMAKALHQITIEEAKDYLRAFHMPPGALTALKHADLRRLNLTFDEE
ncbi:HDOD domain-containing protein [Aliiglaciecola sp. CAU 1673]|uniref:HDOD domain-containing protein n=1 Tax=Aliiglaciecola sp. CAU 1673 TaxID=3032595 RepID=UPI0023DC4F9D|nr:HDOD domain-containing protein [Aliiglaciecola sp. CAU 1673]MDF2178666.1 HDOD domain-containing protein [Aliiglaciecola sp. CAU 1673]